MYGFNFLLFLLPLQLLPPSHIAAGSVHNSLVTVHPSRVSQMYETLSYLSQSDDKVTLLLRLNDSDVGNRSYRVSSIIFKHNTTCCITNGV